MTDCFWTNDVGCYEPGCGQPDPTNVIYTCGVVGPTPDDDSVIPPGLDYVSISKIIVDTYDNAGFGCSGEGPSGCLNWGDSTDVSEPPIGAHYSHYEPEWDGSETVADLSALIAADGAVWEVVSILAVHTNVGIFSYPIIITPC